MKRATPVRTMRHSSNPGRPLQDGAKGPYLCAACETKFSGWETYFCNTLLDPYEAMIDATKTTNIGPIAYDERLSLFLSSVHFRYLKYLQIQNPAKPMDGKSLLEPLRGACLSSDPSPAGVHHYLWFLHPIRSIASNLPPGINTYYFFATDGFCFPWHRPDGVVQTISYVKLPGFALLASDHEFPVDPSQKAEVDQSQIHGTGSLDPAVPENPLLEMIGQDISARVAHLLDQESKIPDGQKQKIEAEIAADPDHEQRMRHRLYLLDCELLRQQQARPT